MKNDKEDVEGPPTYIAEKNTVSYANKCLYIFKKNENKNNNQQLIDNHELY